MKIEQNVPLAPLTTFKIGGTARYYAEVHNIDDLKAAVAYALARSLPIFVLGGGSNILVSDQGFAGLVIRSVLKGIEVDVIVNKGECVAHSGDSWDEAVAASVEKGLWGLENLSLIPGSVGGAVVQNIGAYGTELKDIFAWADALDVRTGRIERFRLQDCDFGYRSSFFKTPAGKDFIITKAAFNLRKDGVPNISYKDLAFYFSEKNNTKPTLKEVRKAVIDIRTSKFPNLAEKGTAGSFFKNPIIEKRHFERLSSTYPDIPSFPTGDEKVKVPAAWLIDRVCKMKGHRDGDAGIFDKQALVLVNHGNATAAEINSLAKKIVKAVYDATGIELEREVESV